MARNRKNQSAAIRFGPALKAILLCLFIGGSGIGYVSQKNLIDELGQEKRQLEMQLKDLRRRNKQHSDILAGLRSPKALDQRVKELNLGLGPPSPTQKRTLNEPAPEPTVTNILALAGALAPWSIAAAHSGARDTAYSTGRAGRETKIE